MISAILLAAGMSKRMGGDNKLIKEVKGKPLIIHSVKNILSSSVDELIIVVGYQHKNIEMLVGKNNKIKFAFNKDFSNGVASSIKVGLKQISKQTESFFICLADMPNVNKNIYNDMIKSKKNNEIIIPTYKNQQGNPVLFSINMKDKIMNIDGDVGAKKIIEMNKDKVFSLETNDLNVTVDFNTKESFSSKSL